jgi:hypothetical protein
MGQQMTGLVACQVSVLAGLTRLPFPKCGSHLLTLKRTHAHSLIEKQFSSFKENYPPLPLFCSSCYLETSGLFLAQEAGVLTNSGVSKANC